METAIKRILCTALALCLPLCQRAYAAPLSGDDIALDAPSAILMEKETGEIIYEKDADKRLFPASVTKIMTMLLTVEAIESGRISPNATVTASERAASFGGSCIYLEAGEQMSVSEMLKCIAVVSANDCAVAISEFISGSEEQFVKRMNERAEQLGMTNTHFTNCTGLFDNGDHYTSARDIALMSRELIRHDMIKEYTTIWMDSIRDGEFELTNTNRLVYSYPGCTGLKTGYTSSSKYCLSATAERDGTEFIAVVMRCSSIEGRNRDAAALLDYAFANCELCSLKDANGAPKVLVELGRSESVLTEYSAGEYMLVPRGSGSAEFITELPASVRAPIKKGDTLGTLRVRLDGREIASATLTAAEDVEKLGFLGLWAMLAKSLAGIY